MEKSAGLRLLLRLSLPLLARRRSFVGGALIFRAPGDRFSAARSAHCSASRMFVLLIRVREIWWETVSGAREVGIGALSVPPPFRVGRVSRLTPEGFTDPQTREGSAPPSVLPSFSCSSRCCCHAVLFALKYDADAARPILLRAIPDALHRVAAVDDAVRLGLDGHRIPLRSIPHPGLAGAGDLQDALVSVFPQGDHFFTLFEFRPRAPNYPCLPRPCSPARGWRRCGREIAANPAVAFKPSAWAARVLAGIQHDSVACRTGFLIERW